MDTNMLLIAIKYGEPVILLGIFFQLISIKEQLKHVMTKDNHNKLHKKGDEVLVRHDQQIKVLNKEVFKESQ